MAAFWFGQVILNELFSQSKAQLIGGGLWVKQHVLNFIIGGASAWKLFLQSLTLESQSVEVTRGHGWLICFDSAWQCTENSRSTVAVALFCCFGLFFPSGDHPAILKSLLVFPTCSESCIFLMYTFWLHWSISLFLIFCTCHHYFMTSVRWLSLYPLHCQANTCSVFWCKFLNHFMFPSLEA